MSEPKPCFHCKGTEYPLPPEAEWVAMDYDGEWRWYEAEPRTAPNYGGGKWVMFVMNPNAEGNPKNGRICHTPDYTGDWKLTKKRVRC